jgi:ribosomal protein S1
MSRTRRVRHPREVVQIGQEVEVKVLKVDEEHRRISLSLKELEADPWVGAVEKFPEKNVVKGTVTRTADFGAFVELEPGVEGLIHISELSDKRVRAVTDVVKPGQEVEVRIIGTDPEKRRISLSMKTYVESHEHAPAAGAADDHKPRKRKKPLRGGLQHTSVVGEWGNLSM